ncbi:hypothetical protein MK489_08320 [Myxococcota bacterium]|nr:hypothetical protein [Myxococcota bacterium]
MRTRRQAATTIASICLTLLCLPLDAVAQDREFTGQVDSVGAKVLVVDNRMGDEIRFVPAPGVTVEGRKRARWSDLEVGDTVTVFWKMVDEPRMAYRVRVLSKRRVEGGS